MKTYLKHKIFNVIDIKELTALEYLDFEGKYRNYVEKHNFWEICYVEDGEIMLSLENNRMKLLNHSITFIPPDATHSYYSKKGNKSRVFVICFECLSVLMKSLGGTSFVLNDRLQSCMEEIIYEYKNTFYMNENELIEVLPTPNFGGQQAIILQMEYLFINLIRKLSTDNNPEIIFFNEESFYAELVDVIIGFLNENISEKLSLDEICNKVKYSKSFVCKTFKEHTGETLFSYFNRIKIEKAKILLKESNLTLSGISNELGFSEAKYFGAMFKKYEGISPSCYREKKGRKTNDKIGG